ncbi:MAG: RHS repeat-associated core domain-containing protein [Anaerolineaceae bacterium]|nr:RHS repeat-associated core domain-containing protein [Anaerolineaceae bacterium]
MISGSFNQESQLLYYASDQIGSTRIVTDGSGTVVYAAAHGPYGGIQRTWTSAYDPSLKFSGKQRDPESELDYFGARYYDRRLHRFLNVDPIINPIRALNSPICWNRYSYCHNSPITFIVSYSPKTGQRG